MKRGPNQVLRFAIAIVLGLASVGTPAPAAAAQTGIVFPPKVKHGERTITFDVRLFLYPACPSAACAVAPGILSDMANNIDAAWNNGLKFECYDLIFNVQMQRGEAWQAPPDDVAVRVDRSSANVTSEVNPANASRWDDSSASARLLPTQFGSNWGSPPLNTETYAHEFGHVLGLDDGYRIVNNVAEDRPGAPHDLMSTGMFESNHIAQETVDKLMHRAGVNEDDLRCGGWGVEISWTDTYDGALDTILFRGSVDTVPLTDEFYGISLIGEGTASGSRGGWKACNPGIDVVPSGNVPATFMAIIDDENKTITVSAYANFDTVLSGISTASFTFDIEKEGDQTADVNLGPAIGDLCPHGAYGTAKLKPAPTQTP